MKVAINDKYLIDKITGKELIYVFDEESLDELLEIPIRCTHKDYIEEVDINLTNYDIDCKKKAKIEDKDWDKIPKKKNYKFAIIVPNYNNDHRRL